MAAMVSIKLDPGMRQYYQRKVAEGKNKMSVLNAIRNKLITRVLAVVRRGIPYCSFFQNLEGYQFETSEATFFKICLSTLTPVVSGKMTKAIIL